MHPFGITWLLICTTLQIYDEGKTQTAKVFGHPWKQARQDDSNHNPQRLWHNLFVHIARTHGMAKNLADWARHSSWIGELHRYNITVISLYILQATPVCCGDVVKKACCIATHTSGGPVLFSYWTAKKLQIWKDFWSLAFCVIFVGWSKHIIITY